MDALGRSFGLGRRKSSMARVWVNLSEGDGGVFVVNKRPMIDYFVRDFHQNEVSLMGTVPLPGVCMRKA